MSPFQCYTSASEADDGERSRSDNSEGLSTGTGSMGHGFDGELECAFCHPDIVTFGDREAQMEHFESEHPDKFP